VPTSFRRGSLAAVLALAFAGCSSSDDCTPPRSSAAPPAAIAVLGAMPSELAPLVERAAFEDAQVIDGHVFHVGTLGGARVVVAMTGIGLVNATETSRVLLDNFAVRGMIFSGVAGSPHRIADVTVPLVWSEPGGEPLPVDEDWLAHARAVADAGNLPFERCTPVPLDDPAAELVCMPFEPALFVSGRGESSDPYLGAAFPCRAGSGDVFGCDPDLPATSAAAPAASAATTLDRVAEDAVDEVTVDMETAAVAREAAARGLPFIAFRAVSDGSEDPLGLPGFPSQFFAYYRLAAENAAIATAAFLEELSAAEAADQPSCS
jgi:nucleoside phosphorylase